MIFDQVSLVPDPHITIVMNLFVELGPGRQVFGVTEPGVLVQVLERAPVLDEDGRPPGPRLDVE